jgi:hypothetical protein
MRSVCNHHNNRYLAIYSVLVGFVVVVLDELESLVFVSDDFVALSDFVVVSDPPFPESPVLLPSDSAFFAPFPPFP